MALVEKPAFFEKDFEVLLTQLCPFYLKVTSEEIKKLSLDPLEYMRELELE